VLLNGLIPAIRIEILRKTRTIFGRAQVLSAAQRQEKLLGEEIESVAGKKPTGSVRNASRASEKDVIYYKYSETGYIIKNCPKKDSIK
jgi:hypothetical protein